MSLKALVFFLVSLFVVVSQASHVTPPPPKVPAVAPYVPPIVRAPHPPTPVIVRAPTPPPIRRRTPLPPVRVRAPPPPIRRRTPPPPVRVRTPPPPVRSRAPPPPFSVRAPPPPVKARTPPPPYTTQTPPPPPAKVTYPPPPAAVVRSPPAKVQPPVPLSACRGLCLTRCGKHSRLKRCMRACEACCKECRCVPTGTHSNYKTCPPCYHQKRTKDGKHKCP